MEGFPLIHGLLCYPFSIPVLSPSALQGNIQPRLSANALFAPFLSFVILVFSVRFPCHTYPGAVCLFFSLPRSVTLIVSFSLSFCSLLYMTCIFFATCLSYHTHQFIVISQTDSKRNRSLFYFFPFARLCLMEVRIS